MRFNLKILIVFCLLVANFHAFLQAERRESGFLYREGTRLMLDGKEFKAAGFNAFTLGNCGFPHENFSLQQIDSLFSILPENFVIRTWAFPGSDRTDTIIKLASKHNLKLILSLGDGRSSCGHFDGAPDGDNSGKLPQWYEEGYREKFLPHVIQTVSQYKHEPAIGLWEIINEPGDAETETLQRFIDDVAKTVKTNDPNHLVTVGCFGPWAYGGPDGYKKLYESEYVDVGNIHEYDYDYKESNQIKSPHFSTAIKLMRELDKPLIIGETGIMSGRGKCRTDISTRVDAMKEKFKVYLSEGASIVLVWTLVNQTDNIGFSFPIDDPLLQMIIDYNKKLSN